MDNKEPEWPREALQAALKIDPKHVDATAMLEKVNKQIAAVAPPATGPSTKPAVADVGVKPPVAGKRLPAKRMVTGRRR